MKLIEYIKEKFRNLFRPEPTIRFKCRSGAYHIGTPVLEARKVFPEWMKKQVSNKNVKFAKCPGMFDWLQTGYIITTWADIHIKANKQGVVIKVDNKTNIGVFPMDYGVVEGIADVKGIPKKTWKIETPWAIFCKKGYSAHVLPASLHFPYGDKFHMYPGIVDYDSGFTSLNVVGTVTEECEFTIPAGTPVLQIIPYRRETITAVCGKATEHELDVANFSFYSRVSNFYRKAFHKRKIYTIKNI